MDVSRSALAAAGLDAMPAQSAILDATGTIVVVNDAWREFADANHGSHPDYWVGENYFEICGRTDDPPGAEAVAGLRDTAAGPRDEFRHEYPCHSPDEQRWFVLTATGFTHEDRRYLVVSHLDITDRKLAERRADAQAEQLETLLGILTHDVRNPLNVIEGRAAALADELDAPDEVESIRRAASRIAEIADATVEFTRTGTLSEVEPVEVAEVARAAWSTVETAEATLTVEDPPRVLGDRRLLRQLFENLFRNSVEHAGADCAVTVGPLADGFYVADDGPGIPESDRDDLLEIDLSTHGRSGLGLSIVHSIVRAHGARIEITESARGGARFDCSGFDVPPS